MRATRLDGCCRPLPALTPCAVAVTDGFISVNYAPNIAEPEEIEVRKANGTVCISDPGCPSLNWFDLEMEFCQIDPELFSFFSGYPLVLDYAGQAVGNRITGKIRCDSSFSLEVWTNLPQEQCADTSAGQEFGYFLAPCITAGIIGEFTIENDALTITFNARTRAGSGWGVGPYDVDQIDAAGTAGPLLTPIGADDHLDMHVTSIAPPVAACGCVAMPAAA